MNAIGLLGSAGMAVVDSTFPLYADRALGLSPRGIGLMFAVMAGTNALLQAIAVGPAMTRFGAVICLRISLTVYGAGCVIVALAGSVTVVMAGLLVLAFAYALFLAPASQLVSNEVGAGDRGAALGMFQGAGNVGRFLTPLASGAMFSAFGASSPFVGAALLMLPALLVTAGLSRCRGS
jgi:MFS family permease